MTFASRALKHMTDWPKITIVTPNYNQGEFIENCILSVINQQYPNLEYFVIDGGSTDNSVAIIKKYQNKIDYWTSEKDAGQSDAINKGLQIATGAIFNWLNADDYLEPGSLFRVAEAYQRFPDAAGWIGACRILDTEGKIEKNIMPNGLEREHIGNNWNGSEFYQPACFLALKHVHTAGGLENCLRYCMDFELYLRILEHGKFIIGNGIWANAIKHSDAKTQKTLANCYLEVISVQKKYGFEAGAKNRFERGFGNGRLEYVMPSDLRKQLKKYPSFARCVTVSKSYYTRKNICFVGNLDSQLKAETLDHFVKKIFPIILKRNSSVQLHLFGSGIENYRHLWETSAVRIKGDLTSFKDAADHYRLCVFPDKRNNEMNTAFGMVASLGIPIVATPQAATGYPVKDGHECFIADIDQEFAEKCHHCLNDPPTWGNFSARLQLMIAERSNSSKSSPENFTRINKKFAGSNKRKKIIVVQGGFPALSATFILDQITGLMDRGFEIENWATYNPQEKAIHPDILHYHLLDRTKYIKLPSASLKSDPQKWLHHFYLLNHIKNLDDIDGFHVHYGSNFNLTEPLFKIFNDTLAIVSFHGYDASRYFQENGDHCYDYLFERADLITTPSDVMKKELVKRNCASDKIQIHHYGVDLNKFSCPERNNTSSKVSLLTVARLVEKKGVAFSLRAVAAFSDRDSLTYRIVGDGPLKKSLQELVQELGIEKQVFFLGAKNKNDVIEEMARADVFLLNSVTAADGDQEGMPVSLIEAQAMGLPVVSSFHAGIPELIENEKTGYLTAEKNVAGIVESLNKLVHDSERRAKFSTRALKRIQREFNIQLLNDRLQRYLEDGLAHRFRLKEQTENPGIKTRNPIDQYEEHEDISKITCSSDVPENCNPDNLFRVINKRDNLAGPLQSVGWAKKIGLYKNVFESAEICKHRASSGISVIIVSNTFKSDLLESLKKLALQRTHDSQRILVNNGSCDLRFDDLRSYVDIYVKLNTNTGAYVSRNIGAIFSNAPILLFLDDDALPADNIVQSYLRLYKKYDVVGVRGVCLPKSDNPLNDLAKHYHLGDKPFPIYSDLEGNSSYKAEAFFAVGGWDDDIFFGGGGVDLARRLIDIEPNKRKQIYSPEPIIYHDFAKDLDQLENKRKKQKESRLRLRKKHPDYDRFLRSWIPYNKRDDLIIRRKNYENTPGELQSSPLSAHVVKQPNIEKAQAGPGNDFKHSIDEIHSNQSVASRTNQPKFSICIPTYNRSEFLKASVQSALDQQYGHSEIIIVDDGSTDDAEAVASSFCSENVRYIKKRHEGAAATRNRCIEEARGDYIVWLDDDDILVQGVIEQYANIIQKEPSVNIGYGQIQYFDNSSGKNIHLYNPSDWDKNKQSLLGALLKGCVIPNPGTLVKKSLYEDVGRYDVAFRRAHDYEFWTRAARHADLRKINAVVAHYRVHDSNLSIGGFVDRSYESKIIRNLIDRYSMDDIFSDQQASKNSKHISAANYLIAKSLFEYRDFLNAKLFLAAIPLHDMNAEMREMRYRCDLFSGGSDHLPYALEQQDFLQSAPDDLLLKIKNLSEQYQGLVTEGKQQIFQHQHAAAGRTVQRMTEIFGPTFDAMLLAAEVMIQAGNRAQACQYLKQAAICGPHHLHLIPEACWKSMSKEEQKEIYRITERLICDQTLNGTQGGNHMKSSAHMHQDIQSLIDNGNYEIAIGELQKLLAADPGRAGVHYNLGVLHYQTGDKDTALHHYQQAAQLQPGNAEFQKSLADFYYSELGQVENALQSYEHVLSIDTGNVQALLICGHIYVSLRRFDDAAARYQRVLEIDPGNPDARDNLQKLQNIGSSRANPNTPEEMYQQIQALINGGNSQEVIEALEKLLEFFPEFALAHNDLGVSYYRAGDKQKALGHYQQAAKFEPDNTTFQKNLADFYFVEMGQVEEALKIYVNVLTIEPNDIETLMNTGHICLSLNKFEDAKVFFNRILEIEPWNADAAQKLDDIQNQVHPNQSERNPDDIYQEIQRLLNGNDTQAAIHTLEKFLTSFPEYALAHNDLGVLYYSNGQKEKSKNHYEKAAALQPGNITFQKNLADYYYVEEGRVEDALRLYVGILEIEPQDVETLMITGHICVALHQFDDAKIFYDRVLEVEPWNTDARENLAKLDGHRKAV